MLSIIAKAHHVSRVLAWIGGALILGSALLVTVEVLIRKFLGTSLAGADEISGYAFGIATTLGLAFALFERAHIRVDALFILLPGFLRAILNLLGLALLVGFAAIITVMAWQMVGDTLKHGSHSITPMRTPLALPQIPWLAGWVLFVVAGLLLFFGALLATLRGDTASADRLIGVKTLDEQIDDERA
ncbi:MAG: TRAP transporter small permease subunit [Minwuia sp.]|uniref:TRAP transporter small permease subunit n=1 Tax=Minwuia sp. TaxID=2493630 RepID=UPI003A835566